MNAKLCAVELPFFRGKMGMEGNLKAADEQALKNAMQYTHKRVSTPH